MGVVAAPALAKGSRAGLAQLLAASAFAVHVALIIFSTIALTTFLAGSPPDWLRAEPNATALRLGWKYSGPTYVVAGGIAALAHAWGRLGARRAIALFFAAFGISLGAEIIGTTTGVPFGAYRYTSLLGTLIADRVPFPIPISWFYMLYGSLVICARLFPAGDDRRTTLRWALVGGAVLTAWDVAMDPAMVRTAHWIWDTPGAWYGMPLTNWLGWFMTGTLIAWVMLRIASPTILTRHAASSRLPIVLYLANGIMPVAICARYGMWYAAVLGAVTMLLPALAALRRARTAT
jgi:uncharacterized membrane protein